MAKAKRKLNNQERLFIAEYMFCKKPKEAALAAGYAKTTASVRAYQWVTDSKNNPKPYIYKEIQKRIGKIEDKLELKNEDVIRELMKIAFSNIQDLIGEDNKILDDVSSIYNNVWKPTIDEMFNENNVFVIVPAYISEVAFKILLGFPEITFKGKNWRLKGFSNYNLSDNNGSIATLSLAKKI